MTDAEKIAIAKEYFGWVAGCGGFDDAVIDFLSAIAAAQPAEPQEGMVPVPTSADQAHGMLNMGLMWLKAHAPERLLAAPTDLHAAIMNIPADTSKYGHASANGALAYKEGHRDARHAAAELVITQRAKGTK